MKKISWFILFLMVSFFTFAQNSAKVKELERMRKAALEEIETTSALLKDAQKSAKSQLNRINLLVKQIENRNKVIAILNDEIDEIGKSINSLTGEIAQLQREYNDKKQQYARAIQGMYNKRGSQDKLLFVLSAQSFSQTLRRLRYLKEYSSWQKLQAQEIKEKQTELENKKALLENTKKEKTALLGQRETEASNLKKEEKEKQEELKGIKKQEKTLKSQLAKKRKQANELNRQIERQIALEIERAEREARIAAEARKKSTRQDKDVPSANERQSATSGGYAMTAQERKLSNDFEKNKGILPFPVAGRSTIIGYFGEQQHRELTYVRTNNNGVDIQATPGADAKAVFNGDVTKVFVIPGYNSSVIVRHGNYLTVYANLKEVYVKAGDKVSTGQAIGRIFTDEEDGNRTVLHFQLWKERTKLNPALWIRK